MITTLNIIDTDIFPRNTMQMTTDVSQSLFELPCLTGRKGRDGTFPASACIKLTGIYDDTGEVR